MLEILLNIYFFHVLPPIPSVTLFLPNEEHAALSTILNQGQTRSCPGEEAIISGPSYLSDGAVGDMGKSRSPHGFSPQVSAASVSVGARPSTEL